MQGKTYYKRVRAWRGRQLQIVAVSGSLAIIAHGCRLLWPRGSRYYASWRRTFIRFGQLDSGDWDGLASRVGHRRSPHATYGSANPADVAYQRLANASQLGEAALSRRALLGSRERVAAPQLLEREPEFLHLDRTELPMV